jgi:hypothetical protein
MMPSKGGAKDAIDSGSADASLDRGREEMEEQRG